MLSICMITKNEEKNIGRCLSCLKPTGFEIIVVDTGSADRTKEIALQYTDKVYDFVWCNDFSAARNFAVSKAAGPYILSLDSDEFLESIEVEELLQLLKNHPGQAGRIRLKNVFTRNGQRQENVEWLNRIFPKEDFYYTGRIHEQITARNGKPYETYQAPVAVLHTGYDLTEAERKRKAERNIALLKEELGRLEAERAQLPDGPDEEEHDSGEAHTDAQLPYILYQLGKSYYMAEDYGVACTYFSRGLSFDLNPKLEYVIDMVQSYGYALLNSGQAETALLFENIYEEFGGGADFQFLMGLIYMNNARFEEAVEEFGKATTHRECRIQGVNSYSAYYNIGVIYECLGRMEQAREYYKKCGNYEPALKRLQTIGLS